MRNVLIFCVMVLVCALVMGTAVKAEAQVIVPGTVTWQVSDGTAKATTYVGPFRARTVYRAAPMVNVEVAPRAVRSYAVVAEPAAPWVRTGVFRDRLVMPRRNVLTAIAQ